jgi:hypothetical protein
MTLDLPDHHLHPNCFAGHLAIEGPEWASSSINQLFERALAESDPEHPPLCQHTIAALIKDSNFEAVIDGLRYILSESALVEMWKTNYSERLSTQSILERIILNPNLLPLTPAQQSVATMMHALHSVGLDSGWHASDRALDILKHFTPQLDVGLTIPASMYSFRLVGAASLIAAQTNLHESASPSGVTVLRAASAAAIPAVMVTAHHLLGGDAVPLVAEYAQSEGILNGKIWCDRDITNPSDADIFWTSKYSSEPWTLACKRLAEKGLARGAQLAVVEDFGQNPFDTPLKREIHQAMMRGIEASPLSNHIVHVVRDEQQAIALLYEGNVAAIMTDLFLPMRVGSHAKDSGERETRRILERFLDTAQVDRVIREARSRECVVGAIFTREFERLLSLS